MPNMNMNMLIAKSHRMSRKFVGLYVSIANILAVILSGLGAAAGIVCLAIIAFPIDRIGYGAIAYYVIAFLAGAILSFLVEGLTISNCARIRKSLEIYNATKLAHTEIEDKTQTIINRKEKQLKDILDSMIASIAFVAFGSLVSALAGMLFWHFVISALPALVAWTCSVVFATVISTVLIWSELAMRLNNQIVTEAISGGTLIGLAYKEASKERLIDQLQTRQDAHIDDEAEGETFASAAHERTAGLIDEVLGQGDGTMREQLQRRRQENLTYEQHALSELSRQHVTTNYLDTEDKQQLVPFVPSLDGQTNGNGHKATQGQKPQN